MNSHSAENSALAGPPARALRTATAADHQRVEQLFALDAHLASRDAYAGLLLAFRRVVAPAEDAIRSHIAVNPPPQLAQRFRTGLIERDLADLDPAWRSRLPAPRSDDGFRFVRNFPSAAGCLYVLEGSTLGGRVIARQLESRLQLNADFGGRYFAGHDAETGLRWKRFVDWLNGSLQPSEISVAVTAARETFSRFAEALRPLDRTDGKAQRPAASQPAASQIAASVSAASQIVAAE